MALADPPPRTGFVERALVAAYVGGLTPIVCLTKSDLEPPEEFASTFADLDIQVVVAGRDDPLDELTQILEHKLTALIGHSGVGKSTLVNRLVPDANRAVGIVSGVGKGRHTSTQSVALPLAGGGWVIDTPGIRSFGLAHISPENVVAAFSDLAAAIEDCPPRMHAPRTAGRSRMQARPVGGQISSTRRPLCDNCWKRSSPTISTERPRATFRARTAKRPRHHRMVSGRLLSTVSAVDDQRRPRRLRSFPLLRLRAMALLRPLRRPVTGSTVEVSSPSNIRSDAVSGALSTGVLEVLVGQRQLGDGSPGLGVLHGKRAGRVRQVVLVRELTHRDRDVLVAVAGQIGEQVVLDLVAQVARHEVHERAALDVGAAEHLTQVPLSLRFLVDVFLGELLGTVSGSGRRR